VNREALPLGSSNLGRLHFSVEAQQFQQLLWQLISLLEHPLQALQTQFLVSLKSQFNKKAQKPHFSDSLF
jgi:hypothetical protein